MLSFSHHLIFLWTGKLSYSKIYWTNIICCSIWESCVLFFTICTGLYTMVYSGICTYSLYNVHWYKRLVGRKMNALRDRYRNDDNNELGKWIWIFE